MKKLFIVFLMFLGVVVASAIPLASVHASTCIVYNEKESATTPYNAYSLRKKVQSYNNGGSGATCDIPSGSADEDDYDQAIYFMTDEWDSTDYYVNHVNDPIVLQTSLSFSNSHKSLVIGMWNSETEPATAYDYGQVTIDAQTNHLSNIFTCDGSTEVTLRNLNILVDSDASDITDVTSLFDDSKRSCLKDGGAVTVNGSGSSTGTDADGDGYNTDTDCNDADENIHPGATESCNSIDDDCDGQTDEGLSATYYYDDDGDGYYADGAATLEACTAPATGAKGYTTVDYSNDCDDANASINPVATEICGDEVDQNCDGDVRSTCESCTNGTDDNGDSAVDCEDPDCASDTSCNGIVETDCTDGLDNDGDTLIDCEETVDCAEETTCAITTVEVCDDVDENGDAIDNDGNGYANCDDTANCSADAACSTASIDEDGDGQSPEDGDCDDANGAVYDGAPEICGTCTDNADVSTCTADGVDNNCDESVDEGCAGSPYIDDDKDGYCEDTVSCSDNSLPGDCDDTTLNTSPGEADICEDDVDNNCDGTVDEASCSDNITPPGSSGCGCDLTAHKPQMTSLLVMILLALIPYMAGYALRSKSI